MLLLPNSYCVYYSSYCSMYRPVPLLRHQRNAERCCDKMDISDSCPKCHYEMLADLIWCNHCCWIFNKLRDKHVFLDKIHTQCCNNNHIDRAIASKGHFEKWKYYCKIINNSLKDLLFQVILSSILRNLNWTQCCRNSGDNMVDFQYMHALINLQNYQCHKNKCATFKQL